MRVTGSRLTFTTATNRHSAVSPAVADASLRKEGEQPRSVRHIDGPATYAQSRSAQAMPQNSQLCHHPVPSSKTPGLYKLVISRLFTSITTHHTQKVEPRRSAAVIAGLRGYTDPDRFPWKHGPLGRQTARRAGGFKNYTRSATTSGCRRVRFYQGSVLLDLCRAWVGSAARCAADAHHAGMHAQSAEQCPGSARLSTCGAPPLPDGSGLGCAVSCRAWLVADANTGKPLLWHNPTDRLQVAGICA